MTMTKKEISTQLYTAELKRLNDILKKAKAGGAAKMGKCNCRACKSLRALGDGPGDLFAPSIKAMGGFKPYLWGKLTKNVLQQTNRTEWFSLTHAEQMQKLLSESIEIFQSSLARLSTIPTRSQTHCQHCGLLINKKYAKKAEDRNTGKEIQLCKICFTKAYVPCDVCGGPAHKKKLYQGRLLEDNNGNVSNRKIMCGKCWSKVLYCRECGTYGHGKYFHAEKLPQQPVHGRAAWTIQHRPQDPYPGYLRGTGHNKYQNKSFEDKDRLCKQCYKNYFMKCHMCNAETDKHDAYTIETGLGLKYVCNTCSLYHVSMHQWNFKPSRFTPLIDKTKETAASAVNNLLFGAELEFDVIRRERGISRSDSGPRDRDKTIRMCKDVFEKGQIWCTADGTIRNGFEIITMPMTERFFKLNRSKFKELIRCAEVAGYSGGGLSCGGHLHINAKAFTTFHVYKFCRFMYKAAHRSLISIVAERTSNAMCYFQDSDVSDAGTKYAAKQKYFPSRDHHSAMSFTKSTIECRFFAGICSVEQLAKNIQFLRSVYEFTLQAKPSELTAVRYLKFITSRTERNKNVDLLLFLFQNPEARDYYGFIRNNQNLISILQKKGQ